MAVGDVARGLTAPSAPLPRTRRAVAIGQTPAMSAGVWLVTGVVFLALFWPALANTADAWLADPDAGHGLLLAPIAVLLAWRAGVRPAPKPRPVLGAAILLLSVAVRYLSGLATGFFFMRLSVLAALVGLIVFAWGVRQVLHWWLPFALLALSMPLPDVVLSTLALPLQMQASQMGAALLEWRNVPVLLTGNVIHLPGHQLFVTEACSGLRSLSSLIALGLLIGALWLRTPLARTIFVLAAIPIAVVLNGVRVFLTGFLVFFVDPAIGEGLMHYTEGWVIFVIALVIQAGVAWTLTRIENVARPLQPQPAV